MDNDRIHDPIERLVSEEHAVWQREGDGSATTEERRQLESVKVALDQCWDLQRQRRALREAGRDAEAARVRGEGVVEGYER